MKYVTICLIPFFIMAVTFALINWEAVSSIGMILFWDIIIMIVYNSLILTLRMFKANK